MVSRRQFLQTSAAIGAGTVTGLSGCLGLGSADVDEWFVEPAYLPGDRDSYTVASVSPSEFDSHSSEFDREDYSDFQEFYIDRYDFTRFYADEIDRIVQGGGGFTTGGYDVVLGEFDAETLMDDLQRDGLRSGGDYEGYELYENEPRDESPRPWAAGVEDETFVAAGARTEDANVLRVVEDLIDTKAGDNRRYQDVDSDFALLMEHSSIGDYFVAFQIDPPEETNPEDGEFRDMVGVSQTIDLAEEDSDVALELAFQREYEPRETDLEVWTRENDLFQRWRDIEIEVSEGNATIGAKVLTRDLQDVMLY